MRRVLFTVGLLMVVVTFVAGATAWATGGRRSDDAMSRLEDGARRLQECHAARDTYDGCESGEAKVENVVRDDAFVLRTDVFGVGHYTIRSRDGGALVRECDATGDRCTGGHWRTTARG
ncbi:MAG: hypothetical protein JWM98_2158 [Thermoleophilia bacterium]|nr:hypothetical protein [Thermoleophilia bacterium]